jgi:hypothetical protein
LAFATPVTCEPLVTYELGESPILVGHESNK